MSSRVLFEAPKVKVTESLLEIKGKTWQIRNVDTVELKYVPFMGPVNTTWGYVLGLATLPIGIGLFILGWAIWVTIKKPRMIHIDGKPTGWCYKTEAEQIKRAVEKAMSSRVAV